MGTGTQGGISFAPGYSESTLRAAHSQIEVPLQGTRTLGTGTRGGTSFAPGYGESTLRAAHSQIEVPLRGTPIMGTGTQGGTSFAPGYGESTLKKVSVYTYVHFFQLCFLLLHQHII